MERTLSRTAGPLDPNENGPLAGDVVVEKGNPVYRGGTTPKWPDRNILLSLPLDKGEVGTAYNGYNYND